MPTRKARIALALPDDLKVTLDALSEATGKPVASVVVQLLVEVQPQLQGLVKVLNAAKAGNKAAAKRALTHMVGDTLGEMMALQLDLPTTKARK
jgi:predicted DNA-binding protein